jgi:hypothetical protein
MMETGGSLASGVCRAVVLLVDLYDCEGKATTNKQKENKLRGP